MSEYKYTQVDFDHPSFFFVLEDWLKELLGCPIFYNPYIKTFGLKGGEKVLDFGCGGGTGSRCLLKLLNSDGHLTCIDTSKYWMKKAEKRLVKFPNATCRVGDIRELALPDESYDVITITHVIHDIDPAERQSIINKLAQKLKKEGLLFVREPIKKSHGMAVREIQILLKNANFWEVERTLSKSEYKGRFLKNEK